MVYLNGEFIPKDQASVSIMDRGFLFGDGVYEVIPVYSGKIFRLDEHLKRLQNSLNSVQINNPYSAPEWSDILHQLLGLSTESNQSLYLQISRGADISRKHSFESLTPTVFIESNPLMPKTKSELEMGFRAMSQPDFRWQRCDIKSTSLLANIMYSQQAKQNSVEEVILHRDSNVTEGATSNVFIIKSDTLLTHPTGKHILSGITRDLVLESAKHCHLNIEESTFTLDHLLMADEVWISSSTREVMPITQVDDRLINNGVIGQHWSHVYDYYQGLKNA
ncbi:D-alanine aminotransferase (EC 2.6.1.21) [uncultured Gammaproteobacteria bacterium]|uniref:D-amino acid aminotransferase n=1 Tax=Bathymodiolus heckerae thiotrophic gill symbiont TaxID=1052212 RepID=UPI0010BBCEBE|nr:D-amino acid aminotransferase [Bathymodiolus heckerae thiotrophic gill symbiont]CAC9530034.1 D-alanine aminotransferase (EC 2.6.1.21) [uncultured Gammaproteobacteria bacterium]CAC9581309.1 D-alanine aminotransferase (EC 2.6.1.21) [uncultured Gammaproteobacteria bacterium]CAC9590126.1 D-alanine aminotransferase (EC 2.6.1.21) [uncultured Gammaproteobacteria bacterium]CAC9592964.1 D-alanine aminotransferase (EC 2.6.1.21) [uncultured Gammaproteobacteria bacterium]CAC9599307.1 D-alanine aminotra